MSIIAVNKLNNKASLPSVVRGLAKTIKGDFEALNFSQSKAGKVCYLKLSEKLDPELVVAAIKRTNRYGAFIPDRVPDLKPSSKRGQIPHMLRKAMRIPKPQSPEEEDTLGAQATPSEDADSEMQTSENTQSDTSKAKAKPRPLPDRLFDENLEALRVAVRRSFNRARNTGRPEDWENHKFAKSVYRKTTRKRRRKEARELDGIEDLKPHQVYVAAHSEILIEMQTKYSGLYNLSKKTQHKLLESVAKTIAERLKTILESNEEVSETGFKLSKAYRKLHPHFGDFQLILSTLHRLQDAAGAPRAQLQEKELMEQIAQPYAIDNIPFNQVRAACTKYSARIIKKLEAHIEGLESDLTQEDMEEDIAKKKVREELKKLLPYLPMIVKQVTANHFSPQKSPFHRMRIYGEPFIPAKEAMQTFLKRYKAVKIMRSDRMYNLLKFNVPIAQHGSLAAMDGTVVGGAKLVIRSSDIPLYKPSKRLVKEMKSVFGVIGPDDDQDTEGEQDDEMDEDDYEDEMAE